MTYVVFYRCLSYIWFSVAVIFCGFLGGRITWPLTPRFTCESPSCLIRLAFRIFYFACRLTSPHPLLRKQFALEIPIRADKNPNQYLAVQWKRLTGLWLAKHRTGKKHTIHTHVVYFWEIRISYLVRDLVTLIRFKWMSIYVNSYLYDVTRNCIELNVIFLIRSDIFRSIQSPHSSFLPHPHLSSRCYCNRISFHSCPFAVVPHMLLPAACEWLCDWLQFIFLLSSNIPIEHFYTQTQVKRVVLPLPHHRIQHINRTT